MRLLDIPKHWKERIELEPDSEFARKALGIQRKIDEENKRDRHAKVVNIKSQVGSILLSLFKRVGGVPCGDCRQTLLRLNRLSVSEIREKHDHFVLEVEKNSKKAKAALWAKLLMHVDKFATDGAVARSLISRWLTEACDLDERSDKDQDGILVGDSGSADLGVGADTAG